MAAMDLLDHLKWTRLIGIFSLISLVIASPSITPTQNTNIPPCQQYAELQSSNNTRNTRKVSLLNGLDHRPPLVIDTFNDALRNNLGFWHGAGEGLPIEYGDGYVRFFPTDPDHNYHTQLAAAECFSFLPYSDQYLHIVFSGTNKFSISLNQNNENCDPYRKPYPETWDSVEAARYTNGNEIYVPLAHFHIDQSRVLSVSFNGFYSKESLTLYKVEIVPELPMGLRVPNRLANDDGQPRFAQEVMDILEKENILVTFFVVGAGLRDEETNFTQVYREMLRRGHQIALHSNTHRKMEGLEAIEDIDDEIIRNIRAFRSFLGVESRYFRPPFGTIGSRTRQRLAVHTSDPQIVNWSVDIEDWLWGDTETPERQLEAFYRDVRRGGNLAVMHYLKPSTVKYFPQVIRFVKAMNLTIMRIDQCLEDPSSPPLRVG
ncbi:bifunctional xylanase/deacetylase [Aspergillus udagawae]|uniref:Bifunctional xylanase/deacetylase n=1 Tax=Aspergillus udagawae TaxID=91492 RepID=A0ABQ1AR38_9EURO|nr:bifunctional xylanase/deacetylase [Aspergillus udagawae]GFF86499.1 bifunctional xylanase/deacetylase [Aspergillus udagawae]GFG15577.1 bifunctional xylanase/deacetylase [Aspergillus udagawae]GFG25182.1 bifunctional xylanase/deacetylase [Aspergillus udagawae]